MDAPVFLTNIATIAEGAIVNANYDDSGTLTSWSGTFELSSSGGPVTWTVIAATIQGIYPNVAGDNVGQTQAFITDYGDDGDRVSVSAYPLNPSATDLPTSFQVGLLVTVGTRLYTATVPPEQTEPFTGPTSPSPGGTPNPAPGSGPQPASTP